MLQAIFLNGVDEISVAGLTQWDRGQELSIVFAESTETLPSTYQVHFTHKGRKTALAVTVFDSNVVEIPDELLMQNRDLIAYVYLYDATSGETVKTINMPITPRAMPEDYTKSVTPSELVKIMAAISTTVSNSEQAVADAKDALTLAQETVKLGTTKRAWDLELGDVVPLSFNGTVRDFVVVHQGKPHPTYYDDSCEGTWLLCQNAVSAMTWNLSSGNNYAESYVHQTALPAMGFDPLLEKAIKEAQLPYTEGNGSSTIKTKRDGVWAQKFLLSRAEVGMSVDEGEEGEGYCLDYFKDGTDYDERRIAYNDSGTAVAWWLRTPVASSSANAFAVRVDGYETGNAVTAQNYIRPAIILPFSTKIDPLTNEPILE